MEPRLVWHFISSMTNQSMEGKRAPSPATRHPLPRRRGGEYVVLTLRSLRGRGRRSAVQTPLLVSRKRAECGCNSPLSFRERGRVRDKYAASENHKLPGNL